MRCLRVCAVLAVASLSPLHAAEVLPLSAAQIQSLGIETAQVAAHREGELPGLPAQVVVPNNQMHVVSSPMPVMVEQMFAAPGEHVGKGSVLVRLQGPAIV